MNTFKINLSTFIIIILIALLILQRQCRQEENLGEVVVKTEVRWDTLKVDTLIYVPEWKTRVPTQTDSSTGLIKPPADTAAILEDYFASYVYEDTVRLDSFGYLAIRDTISRNKIISREVEPAIRVPITTITKTSPESKTKFYTGVSFSGNRQAINQVNGELLLKTKSGNIYGLGLGVNPLWQPVISASAYWELKIKKPDVKLKLL